MKLITKKIITAICLLLVLFTSTFSDIALISSKVYAATENENIAEQNEQKVLEKSEENEQKNSNKSSNIEKTGEKTGENTEENTEKNTEEHQEQNTQKNSEENVTVSKDNGITNDTTAVLPIITNDFEIGEKVAILINNKGEIKVVPTSYSDIENLCDEETKVYFGKITQKGIEVEKTDETINTYLNKTEEELNKIVQILTKEELNQKVKTYNSIIPITEEKNQGIMTLDALSQLTSNAVFGVVVGSLNRFGHEMHFARVNGQEFLVFCMEYGKTSPTNHEYVYGSEFTAYTDETLAGLATEIYFGHVIEYGTGIPSTDEGWKSAIAAQQQCWWTSKEEGYMSKYPIESTWKSNWLTYSSYLEWYNALEQRISQYYDVDAEQHTYYTNKNWSGLTLQVGKTKELNDDWFKRFGTFSTETQGVKFEHESRSNILKITASKVIDNLDFNSADFGIKGLLPNGSEYNPDSTHVYIAFTSSSIQNMLYSNYVEPIVFHINLKAVGGKISLTKVDKNGNGIQGAVFSITAAEDIQGTDKEYSKGEEIGRITTGAGGRGTLESVPLGKYNVTEVSVPRGYILDTTVHQAEVTETNSEIDLGNIENAEPTGKIIFKKVNDNGDGLGGVEFELYADENITDASRKCNLLYKRTKSKICYNVRRWNSKY